MPWTACSASSRNRASSTASGAIAFGEFHHCGPDEGARYEWTVKEVLQAYARKWGKPAVMGLPFGHGADNAWLPLGRWPVSKPAWTAYALRCCNLDRRDSHGI